jgi:hypothetical protein
MSKIPMTGGGGYLGSVLTPPCSGPGTRLSSAVSDDRYSNV